MNEPVWLGRGEVETMHEMLIQRFGGTYGVRDEGAIDSTLAHPRNKWESEKSTLPDLAAAYAYGLAKNHGYVDGNKRIGFTCAAVFLDVNGHRLVVEEPEAVLTMTAVCSDEIDEAQLAAWFSEHTSALIA